MTGAGTRRTEKDQIRRACGSETGEKRSGHEDDQSEVYSCVSIHFRLVEVSPIVWSMNYSLTHIVSSLL